MAVVGLLVLAASRAASAQPATVYAPPLPTNVKSTNSVTIGGLFDYSPKPTVPLSQSAVQGPVCNPGACFSGALTVRGNRGWSLQVSLASIPTSFTVAWVELTPPYRAYPLTTVGAPAGAAGWQTVATGTAPTAGKGVTVAYYANKTNGKGGAVPTASQVAAVLQYRMQPNP